MEIFLMLTKAYTVQELAQRLQAEVIGDRDKSLKRIMPLERASADDLSFLAPSSRRNQSEMLEAARRTKAGAVLVKEYDADIPATQICTPNPMAAVIGLSPLFAPAVRPEPGVHPQACVSETAVLGRNVSVGAFAVIGDFVEIGDDTVIHPHVVIYTGAVIGKQCTIHSGATIREFVRLGDDCLIQNGVVLGGDGFGYIPDKVLGHRRIPHIGTLVLDSGVDIGANSTVDRAMLGEASIGRASKIDNLVMVGHNCEIGERVLMCGMVGVSGSCKIGNDVILAGNVGVADHITIGDNVRAAAKAGITSDVSPNQDIAGHPQIPASSWRRQRVLIERLPELFRKVKELDKFLSRTQPAEEAESEATSAAK
jgi:UDP-3-O-[3-hydroxymyristoyl] glucosamine N-acyltransferase